MKRLLHSAVFFYLAITTACSSDYGVTDQSETRIVIDSFTQADEVGELDILVALDTSGSMWDDADEVGTGIEIFRSDIENLTTSYRFGFITTDSQYLGFMGPYDATASSIDLMLAPGLLPSVAGEAGFESTYVFMNSDDGIDFRRQSADFLLFLISDEDEQSSIVPSIFQDWLYEFLPDVQHDVVAITTDENSDCGWEIGFKYTEIANLYNKDSIDICGDDWNVWLSESSFITRKIDSISLSEPDPVVESIVVYVEELFTYDWEYVEEENFVQLGFTPNPGEHIVVAYKVVVE